MKTMFKRFFTLFLTIMMLSSCAQAGMYTGTALDSLNSHTHHWTLISTTDATCKKAGVHKYKCTGCGKIKKSTIARLAHIIGEWTITKESTCKKAGKVSATCIVCGKKLTYTLPKAAHTVTEWKITKEATATKAGKRTGKCSVCGKKVTESYYVDGVIWIYSDAWLIREVQIELRRLGYYTGDITGIYSDALIKAIKKYQKHYKFTADGVVWPDMLAQLGVNQAPGTPITEKNLSGYTLQLTMEMVSEPKASYEAGETIVFKWTVENKSKKDAKNPGLNLYLTDIPNAETDTVIDEQSLLEKRGTLSGTYEYTVKEGETRIGFVVRAKINKKTTLSNTVQFKLNNAAAEEAETDTPETGDNEPVITIE